MNIVKKSIREAIDRLEGLEFYESWADSKVTEILEKLKNAEKEIETLQNTVKSSGTLPSLKETAVLGIYNMFPVTGSTDPEITGRVWESEITPDYRDQWSSQRRYTTPGWVTSTGTYRNFYAETPGNQNFREYLKQTEDQPNDTDGTKLARSWVKFYDNASDAEKVKILTKIIQELVPGGFL